MLRDKNLIPLSHQHQHALALCVRIDRASPIAGSDLSRWLEEVALHFRTEIEIHFLAEEKVLFPAARHFAELNPLVEDLLKDHSVLRENFVSAEKKNMSPQSLRAFANYLSAHIRKEESQLFEGLQRLMTAEELASLGAGLSDALQHATGGCILPTSRRVTG
jgi:hemerythrin-like domain-containing protein